MRKVVLALGVSLLVLPSAAQAHFTLLMPPSATNQIDGKGPPPCGPSSRATPTMPSGVITAAQGGHPLKINIDETVYHRGFYRVALSTNSRSELPADNVVYDADKKVLTPTGTPGMSFSADYDMSAKPAFPVLVDHLWDHSAPKTKDFFTTEVTLPNITCPKCTLQVIEFMADHGPNAEGAGYFYHNCADLKITADPNLPPFASGGAGGGSAGGAAGAAGSAGASSAGAAGALTAGSGGTAGDSAGGAPGAGAPATGGSPGSAGFGPGGASSVAGSAQVPIDSPDAGGCSVSARSVGSKVWLSVLVGLVVLGGRRRRRSC